MLLGIINELKRPEIASACNVDYSLLWTLVDVIEKDLNERITKCQELDKASEQMIPVNSVNNMNATKPSEKGFLLKLKHR